jgi:hypothetical protein
MKKFALGAVLGVVGAITLSSGDASAQVVAAAPYAAIPFGYQQAQFLGQFNDVYSCQLAGGADFLSAVEFLPVVGYVLEFNGFQYVYVPVTQYQCWGLQTVVIAQPFTAKEGEPKADVH